MPLGARLKSASEAAGSPLCAVQAAAAIGSRVMRRRFWTRAARWNSWVGLALDHVELVRDPGRAPREVLAGDGLLEFNEFSCQVRLIALVLLAGCIL
jgi:hypothetical protein